MQSRISSKGQVTVPIEVRRKLGLRTGTVVEFEIREGLAVVRKSTSGDHPVDVVYGSVDLAAPVDRLLDDTRGARPDPSPAARKKATRRTKSGQ